MNLKVAARVVSAILALVGLSMLTSVFVSWIMGDPKEVILGLLLSSLLTTVIGGLCCYLLPKDSNIRLKEGFIIVTFSWLTAALFGSIPFVLVGKLTFVDAFFETMSGFTTTGASVLNNIEALPKGLLYWRSLTNWLGGMGIIVLSLAILPILKIGGMQLYKAEVPGPSSDRLTPRIANSAKLLWWIYIFLSFVETILLKLGGMSLFDAWCHTCGTMATGGFSTKQESVKYFNSAYIDMVITVFMFLAGCNFVFHFHALKGRSLRYWQDEEFRLYLLISVFSIVTIAGSLLQSGIYGQDIWTILRHSSFTAISILTTTGFCTENFDIWPIYTQSLLLCIMFIGGCGGSTSGGMKVSRFLLVFKYSLVQIRRCFYPRSLVNIRLNNHRVNDVIMDKVLGFFVINVNIFVLLSLLVCVMEPGLGTVSDSVSPGSNPLVAMETAFSSVVATLYNIGPGFGQVGPSMNYEWMSNPTKILLSFTMLVGRLEVYTVLVLFLPVFWRK